MRANKLIENLDGMTRRGEMDAGSAQFLTGMVSKAEKFEFDFGDWPSIPDEQLAEKVKVLRLPFETCYFSVPGIGGLVAHEPKNDSKRVMFHPFYERSSKRFLTPNPDAMLAFDKHTGKICSIATDPIAVAEMKDIMSRGDELELEIITGMASLVLIGLSVMDCSNVTCVDNEPPAALNKKRMKSGKVPIFSFKTLHINTKRAAGTSSGEASSERIGPRVHLRRGHIRRIDPIRTTWVQSCLVGDKARGVVLKDYRVTS